MFFVVSFWRVFLLSKETRESSRLIQVDAPDAFDRKLHAIRKRQCIRRNPDYRGEICKILEKTARSPSTVTVRQETQVVEENVHGVTVQVLNVLLMVVCFDFRTELIPEIMSSPVTAVIAVVPRPLRTHWRPRGVLVH